MDKVKVALRLRPFNRREIELGAKCVVDMDDNQTILYNPGMCLKDGSDGPSKGVPKTFAFDHCFWSMVDSNPKYATQDKVFRCLGHEILDRAFEGYNACIFAYGQTGSGKSYSMMGTVEQRGIIPRICDALFDRIQEVGCAETSFKVEVSYMEIYNEKVRDLLDPKGKHNLKVREHTILGPYVDGLSTLAVSSFEDIDNLMCEGNKSRTVAATNMNSESSRSHAVFNIILTQTLTDLQTAVSGEKVSKLSLVDLAGSERAQKTGAVGERLKEGSNINKSLTTLGLVISALADQASGKSKTKFVPYRDSVLTWLLKDNLGGNSKTVMIATLSPAADNYEETLSTLRYADRAKRIVNHAVVNEDPNARIIRELREEVEMLRKMLNEAQSLKSDDLRERLEESEKLMNELEKTWEDKLKETERIHMERHAALEKMGISVQTSGIKVEQGKYYLVNLNADPSLNELLVYYLKEITLIGRPDAPHEQDIQLLGLGIMSQHCVIVIEGSDVYLIPLDGARTCVNGRTVTVKTRMKHGDRILWGNNHFFRINCPKANSPSSDVPENIDYDFAQQELMLQQMEDDPIQVAIRSIEKQHEEDKQEALEKQRQMYERQMQLLRSQLMSPSTPSMPYSFDAFSKMTPTGACPSSLHPKYQQWARDREKLFRQSLAKLKEDVVKANTLVREANFLVQEMAKPIEFSVTLQIPAANLSPNRRRGGFVSEPAVFVKYKNKGSQVWSMDKFENKLIDMRDIYEDRKEKGLPLQNDAPPDKDDPFYESQENHSLIGVANIFLESLFYDVKLEYQVPIISQQGEVAGRLHMELCRVSGSLSDRYPDDSASESSTDTISALRSNNGLDGDEESSVAVGVNFVCQIGIKEARGLPPVLSNFVFCQYTFWGCPEPIVVPSIPQLEDATENSRRPDEEVVTFSHSREFTIHVTEEFAEHCADGALSVEVWGNRSSGFSAMSNWQMDQVHAKSRSIADRWSELTRKIELWVEIHELNEQGEYMPVEVIPKPEVPSGGIFQLRQGHSRRILVCVKPVHNSGTLPIICESVNHVSIGCVCARSKLQRGLDSYQEEDLSILREKWSDVLAKRREYLDEQLQKIMSKEEKTEADTERERSLIDQWVCLTEERNAVLVPTAGSGIPGAPADWDHPSGMEQHIPVIFLDLNAEDMTSLSAKEGMQAAGGNSILPKEHGSKFFSLPVVKNSDKDVCTLVSWDSSVHDSIHLNRVTPNNERVYLIVKVVVQLSHPAAMELVIRKRICINVYKRQSIADKLRRKIGKMDCMLATGVTYEIVSNIPKASEDLEDRESLAVIAASQNDQGTSDGETYIEKYIKGVSAVDSILALDRLRQEVAIKELLAQRGRPLRKATSVPNIHNILTSPPGLHEQIRSDSIQDLIFGRESDRFISVPKHDTFHLRPCSSPCDIQKDVPVGLSARPNFLNLRSNLYNTCPTVGKPGLSPAQPAKHLKPLSTLVEEQTKPQPAQSNMDYGSDNDVPGSSDATPTGDQESLTSTVVVASIEQQSLKHDVKIMDAESADKKSSTPGATSSGYGSAVSTHMTADDLIHSEHGDSGEALSVDDTHHEVDLSSVVEPDDAASKEPSTEAANLIDSEVPSDLGSPLKPTTPYADRHPGLVADRDDANDDSQDVLASDANVMSGENGIFATDLRESLSETVSSSSDVKNEQNITGIDGSDDRHNTAVETDTFLQLNTTDSGIECHDIVTTDEMSSKLSSCEPDVDIAVGQQSSINTDEHSNGSNDHHDNAGVSKVSGAAKLKPRSADKAADKATPAPVKATYRPVPIPPEMTIIEKDQGFDSREEGIAPDSAEVSFNDEDTASLCSFGSRADLHRLSETPLPAWIQVGEPVLVIFSQGGTRPGFIQFVGTTEFAPGNWIGVELDVAEGKNDGCVKGIRYFRCRPQHGVFVRHDKLIHDKKRAGRNSKVSKAASNLRRSTGNLSASATTSAAAGHKDASSSSSSAVSSSLFRPTAASAAKHK